MSSIVAELLEISERTFDAIADRCRLKRRLFAPGRRPDIRSSFDRIDHEWKDALCRTRIGDPPVLRVIRK